MKTIYFQCNMGAAGDMIMAALLELLEEPEEFIDEFNSLNIPNVHIDFKKSEKMGIVGGSMIVSVNGIEEDELTEFHNHVQTNNHSNIDCNNSHEIYHSHDETFHHHSKLADIENLIDSLNLSEKVKEDAKNVYKIIAEAESKVHGKAIDNIHFHEVGTMDAVADVVGVCMLIEKVAPDKIMSSPIHVGSGQVRCAHGILPVPAPATALILKGAPIYGGGISGELCTPTGAALITYFAEEYGDMPRIQVEKIGYGMGKKDFSAVNCIRCFLGETEELTDSVSELCCNLDDMTGEAVGYAVEVLLAEGALDVYTTSVAMKKNRPGTMLTCMCRQEEKQKFISLIFKYTTTIGIREYKCSRYVLNRKIIKRETEFGAVDFKRAEGFGVVKEKAEYEDIKAIADKNNCSFTDVLNRI